MALAITKQHADTSYWKPFEKGSISVTQPAASRLVLKDGDGRVYVDRAARRGQGVSFAVRGSCGRHAVEVLDKAGRVLAMQSFRAQTQTGLACDKGPYAEIAQRIQRLLQRNDEHRNLLINDRLHHMLVTWGRDHVHTLKAQKYFMDDVKSGLEYWLETQEKSGMFWDCIHSNGNYPARTWFGEALGKGYYRYEDHMKYIVRRIPVEADCEFLYTEGVWYTWKASGDDAWMAKQLPRLEKALSYNSSHPARWSKKHGLVRRSFCMDSWDFVNPHYCHGDHRCINKGDPQFLFHGDNSGLYSSYWRMAEMYEHLGNAGRARQLRSEGERLRRRANAALFFGSVYGHMIPETLNPAKVYALVGDERKRMSLSTGYTMNRKLPTHAMTVKILKEYQRRGKEKKKESFAEWWTMDPPYQPGQWGGYRGTGGSSVGEYMNGAICTIIAGEVAKAAFDHGYEGYGADILERVWELSQRDGGELHQVYRRLPEKPVFPKAHFQTVDLRPVANRGLVHGAHKGVAAWTDEGHNDMRNLPVGRQRFGLIEFDVIDPAANGGRSVLALSPCGDPLASSVTIPTPGLKGSSLYFLHALGHSAPAGAVVGIYEVQYSDGTSQRVYIRSGVEIGHWWGPSAPRGRGDLRLAWRGANPQWADVGIYMYGWNNPCPGKPITGLRVGAAALRGGGGGIMLAGVSLSDHEVFFEERIRSHGLPDSWAQAAVYYAVAEGLAGIEDRARAFSSVSVAPRWAATQASKAEVTLHYPASGGYCSYRYRLDRKRRSIGLDLTGSFDTAHLHCLLPRSAKARSVIVDGKPQPFKNVRIEKSTYADFELKALPLGGIVVRF